MSRTQWILIAAFCVTLSAGVAVGLLGARIPQAHQSHSWLKDELGLSDQQSSQMETIWKQAQTSRQDIGEKRRAFDKQRADAIVALMTDEQKARYDALNQTFWNQMQDLNKQRDEIMTQADEKTRQLLTADQRKKYDEIMEKRRNEHGQRGPGGPGGPNGGGPGGPGPHRGGPDGMGPMDHPAGPAMNPIPMSEPTSRPN